MGWGSVSNYFGKQPRAWLGAEDQSLVEMKIVFFISVAILTCLSIECESIPPGHMQPLGSHMPPLEVEVLNSFPDPLSFHSKYVQRNLPVKLKGLMKDTDVLKNWQSDEYLR